MVAINCHNVNLSSCQIHLLLLGRDAIDLDTFYNRLVVNLYCKGNTASRKKVGRLDMSFY